jgi:hypothetical protein
MSIEFSLYTLFILLMCLTELKSVVENFEALSEGDNGVLVLVGKLVKHLLNQIKKLLPK